MVTLGNPRDSSRIVLDVAKLFSMEISIYLIWGRGLSTLFKSFLSENMAQYLSAVHVALGLIPLSPQTQRPHSVHMEVHIGLSTWEEETGALWILG